MIAVLNLVVAALMVNSVSSIGYSCSTSVDRLKKGPDDFVDIINSGRKYSDSTFNGQDMMNWPGLTGTTVQFFDNAWCVWFGTCSFEKLPDVYPTATLWGSNSPDWTDINQGMAGNCYIQAAMGMISEFPQLVKDSFVTQDKNDAGIYAVRFFIRGKPWVITVDDYMVFYNNTKGVKTPMYSRIGTNNQFWGMILEKAFAKMKGTYASTDGGYISEGMSTLTGCPIYHYNSTEITDDAAFTAVKAADDLNYIMGAGTNGGTDSTFNTCGIANGHAYTIISAFYIYDTDGTTVLHKMYMVRNPWGISYYSGTWNSDSALWTTAFKAQVPKSVDPTTSHNQGIFFVPHTSFRTCFQDFQVGHYRDGDGYSNDWYDKEGDGGSRGIYTVNVPANDGDLYITTKTYHHNSIPGGICWSIANSNPIVRLQVYKNSMDNEIAGMTFVESKQDPIQITSSQYSAGDTFYVAVQYNWNGFYDWRTHPFSDYTLLVYSKQNLSIKNANGNTNMWHMDGQYPSHFEKSHYRKDTTVWTPEFKPHNIFDAWYASNNLTQFMYIVFNNFWLVVYPLDIFGLN